MFIPKPILFSLSMALALLGLCLAAVTSAPAYAGLSAHPLAQPQLPSMSLTKTVGTDPTACATTSEVRVVPGTPVYECFTLMNTGPVTLTVHTLSDTRIGDAAFIFPLAAGQTEVLTQLQPFLGQFVFTPTASTVSTITVYATGAGLTISDTATARVTMIGAQGPDLALAHTLSTQPDTCGTTDSLNVAVGTPVYSCFTAVNTSSEVITMTLLELPLHYYYDTSKPPPPDLLILPPFIWPLAAGESAHLGTYPFTATASMITSGTVVYNNVDNQPIAVTATARVNVTNQQVGPTIHLPLIQATHSLTPATPVFSATMHVAVSKIELNIGETTNVQVAIDVSEGCQYPIFELELMLTEEEQSMFTFLSPTTALVGPGVSNPFTYTLRAEKSGAADFEVQAYGERYCKDFWNWHYVTGTSPTVTVR
ncbi:MAG: hypothetical protein R3A44_01650 [Caldilineaceae bacterium]